ncbi:MAG TPA: aldo/keto reductase [Gemmatimonadaceae bacterium]|nr:aldo/keto reductase [Gemmatimonadaceae bacterium]
MSSASSSLGPRRRLGRTGFLASRLGIGDLADRNVPLADCVATARRAIAAGLNVIDTAPNYEEGYSEQVVGATVRDCRAAMFVIDKVDFFDRPVTPQVDESLGRLDLPFADAFVFHGLSDMDVFERLAAPGGGFDELADCIAAGKSRFRGISSHSPDVLRAAIERDLCDVVMFAVGPFVDRRYVTEILPLAKARDVGTVCFKTFGAGKLLGDTAGYNQPLSLRPRGKLSSGGSDDAVATLPRLSVEECVRYTLTLDPDVALLGLSFANEQDAAFAAAGRFVPFSAEEMEDVRVRAVEARREKGACWWNPDPEG